ncbi:MAG TPA: hypothetical protein VMG59_10985 [Phycisphaerae bacterium]|nr:hypothetical protein [Phycisphaerae bacterium]
MRNLKKTFLAMACMATCTAIAAAGIIWIGQIRGDTGTTVNAAGNTDEVLDHVPASADLVEVINDLSGLHDKLTTLMQKLQIPGQIPPVGFFAAKLGVAESLDKHGSIAVIWPQLIPSDGGSTNPIILLPATDPDKMLSSMNPVSQQNGISSVQPRNSPPGFVAVTGHYVALSEDQQTLVDFLASKQSLSDALSTNDENMIDASDIGVYINVAAIREPAEKALDANFANSIQMFQSMGMAQNQKTLDQMKFSLAVDKLIIHEILDDIKVGVASATISDDGISIDLDHQFETGTPMADFVAQSKPLSDKPFAGLPKLTPTIAFSADLSGGWLSELIKNWSDKLTNDPDLKSNTRAQQVAQQWNQVAQLIQLAHTQSAVMSFTPMLKGFSSMTVDDPDQALNLQRQIAQNSIDNLQLQNNEQLGFSMSGQFTQDALTVDGVSFDKSTFNIAPSAAASANPGSAMITQITQTILGPNGINTYTGIEGNNIISGVNASNDELQGAVEAAKNSTDDLDSQSSILAGQEHLLPNASIIAYGQPSAMFAALLNSFQGNTGAQTPAPSSTAMTLSGSLASFSQSGSLGRIYLPTSELEAISNQVHQMLPMLMMMGMSQQQQPMQPRQ